MATLISAKHQELTLETIKNNHFWKEIKLTGNSEQLSQSKSYLIFWAPTAIGRELLENQTYIKCPLFVYNGGGLIGTETIHSVIMFSDTAEGYALASLSVHNYRPKNVLFLNFGDFGSPTKTIDTSDTNPEVVNLVTSIRLFEQQE